MGNEYFNSHTREGVTTVVSRIKHHFIDFNSHTREGVTLIIVCGGSVRGADFNSHTREGVTDNRTVKKPDSIISTHTPVRV